MKMRIYLSMLMALFLVSSVSAELILAPNPLDVDVKMNTPTNFTLNLTNTFPFRIMDFEYSNLSGFTFPNIVLDPNETRQITFAVEQTEVKSVSISSDVKFKYLVDLPNDPQTYYVNITVNGFSPDFLTIHEGDTVIWTNHDDLSHTVTGADFDFELAPNGTASKTFTAVGTQNYQDLILFWAGRVEVISKTAEQKVNNPSYNKVLTVNMNVIANPTVLSINILDKSFSMDPNAEEEGMLSIENTGSEIAQKVSVSSNMDWITFDKTNFNIDSGKKTYVSFKISPFILQTNETNMTYTATIEVSGLNTGDYSENISVFIRYRDLTNDEKNPEYIINIIEGFCKRNPYNAFCNTTSLNQQPQVIIQDPEIPVNLTASQVYAILKRIQRIEDSNQRTDNKINTLSTTLETELPQINKNINDSVTQQKKTENSRATTEAVFWVLLICGILIVGFIIGWDVFAKYKHKRYLMGDAK